VKVKKKGLNLDKIIIDIVLCPKTSLYLQNLYCHKCAYFNSDERDHISCNYKKLQIKNVNQKKEELIKIFSKVREKNEISTQYIANKKSKHDSIRDIEALKADLSKELKKKFNENLRI